MGYGESARAPTPVELTCASPDPPCSLPNTFLADPPLKQVVAKGIESGMRGRLTRGAMLNWRLGYFDTTNEDDIIFESTGGITSNQGFFANVGDTRRRGVELGLNGKYGAVDWFLNYGFVQATFETGFTATSPNHPDANDLSEISVRKGDRIPGIPEHSLKLGADVAITPAFTLGGDLVFNSDQNLREDEANLLQPIDAYVVVNVRGEYRFNKHLSVFARVNNLFNSDYETFGILGEPSAVLGSSFDDPRFLSPGAPISELGQSTTDDA